jgi:probable O-glycosylation ligase (exosortase A-associated)
MMAAMALTAVAILGTYSRGALLGGMAMGLYLLLKSPYRLQLALGGALVLIPVLLLLPQKWYDRMETIQNYQEDSSAMGRIYAWQFTGRLIQARPLVGGGFEPYTAETYQRYAPDIARLTNRPQGPHSNYFKVLGEHGPIGLFLYLGTMVLGWRKAGWIIRRTRERADLKWAADLAAMIQVSLVGYAVAGAFLGMTYFDLYYHLLAVLVLLPVILQPQLASAASREGKVPGQAVGAEALPGGRW